MAERKIAFADLKDNEKVTLKLREGESVIVGKVEAGFTAQGGRRIKMLNNANSVVIYRDTNFRIFADRGPTAAEAIGALSIGTVFTYRNKYGNVIKWVVSGENRVTRVDDARPAYSLSITGGFTSPEEVGTRLAILY